MPMKSRASQALSVTQRLVDFSDDRNGFLNRERGGRLGHLKEASTGGAPKGYGPENIHLVFGFQQQRSPEVRGGVPPDYVDPFWREQPRPGQLLGYLKSICIGHILVEFPVG